MNQLATLEEQDIGTDVAIVMGSRVEHWTVADGGALTRNGMRLEPFFLTGLLRDGRIVHGNFAPAQVGEWFRWGSRIVLVVWVEDNVATIAEYQQGAVMRFVRFSPATPSDLGDRGMRVEPPALTQEMFLAMTQQSWHNKQRGDRHQQQVDSLHRVHEYLTYIGRYSEQAKGLINQ